MRRVVISVAGAQLHVGQMVYDLVDASVKAPSLYDLEASPERPPVRLDADLVPEVELPLLRRDWLDRRRQHRNRKQRRWRR